MSLLDSTVPRGFARHELDEDNELWVGTLPTDMAPAFDELWDLHPSEFHEIKMHGRLVKTPRWQQAYGMDYQYTGRVNKALPIPTLLNPIWTWAKEQVDSRLNGILLNWYDGKLDHYIGKHRDSTKNMVPNAPIVTVSLGQERVFRLRPYRGKKIVDFAASNATVFVMPYATNLAWTHEVPRMKKYRDRRISITFRAFSKPGD